MHKSKFNTIALIQTSHTFNIISILQVILTVDMLDAFIHLCVYHTEKINKTK